MGEIAINPKHNVFKKYKSVIYVNPYLASAPVILAENTFIGGVASTLYTPGLLAAKLGIDVSRIANFSVVGSDIKCRITGEIYNLLFQNDTNITYYKDTDNLVKSLSTNYASSTTKLLKIEFNGVTSIGTNITNTCKVTEIILPNCISTGPLYSSTNSVKNLYIPRVTNLAGTSGQDDPQSINIMATDGIIYANPILATNNAGSPDGDLSYVINAGIAVRYVTNFTIPNPVTTLTTGIIYNSWIQLNFTPPSATNTIDYYEVYVNGFFSNKIYASGEYARGLSPSTSYNITIYAMDIFYNKSLVSNNVIESTNTTNVPYAFSNIVSYYKMGNNVVDSIESNYSVPTRITYVAGLNGQRAVFNGSNSKINCSNISYLQLTNGSVGCVLKASSSGSSYRGIVVKQNAYGLFLNNGVLVLYDWTAGAERNTGVNINDGLNHVLTLTFQSGVTNGTKVYIDGNLVLTTTITVLNQNVPLVIGAGGVGTQFINAQIDEVTIWNKELNATEVSEFNTKLLAGQSLI